MKDPILDEGAILALLAAPPDESGVDRLQFGAVQALVDLYDRGCSREEFVSLAAPCIALSRETSKLYILRNVRKVFEDGFLSSERFDAADRALEDLVRAQAVQVTEVIKRLQMCPTSRDVVH